jgi:Lar family restriction alleviation protein
MEMVTIYGTPSPCNLKGLLAPCPFCGSVDLYIADRYAVECGNQACDAIGPLGASVEDVITAWNRRPVVTTQEASDD